MLILNEDAMRGPDLSHPQCQRCRYKEDLDFDFSFALQPIVDFHQQRVFAHEALVRGVDGAPAHTILSLVNDHNRYRFDQNCRIKAVKMAAELGVTELLSINFLPNAVYQPEACIQSTLAAAKKFHFPRERIIFEVVEGENLVDRSHLLNIFREYRRFGFNTAIDDFGSGYSGLNLLAEFQPNIIKLDMELIRDIDQNPVKQAIVTAIVQIGNKLDIQILAEGIESKNERDFLLESGIHLFQGYLFCKPAFEAIGKINDDAWR